MSPGKTHTSATAAAVLVLATFFWAASFPVMKALEQHQQTLAPAVGTWFLSSMSVLARFGLAGLVLAVWHWRDLRDFSRGEFWQGAGLGFFGGLGILLQMDAVNFIAASTSAFLTQCYCIFVPIFIAWHRRAWPSKTLALSCVLVLVGVAELSNINWSQFRLGRGEAETIVGSLFFTGQILWLERPIYAGNRSGPVTLIMFAMVALLVLPVAVLTGNNAQEWQAVYGSTPAIVLTVFLSLVCTLIPYTLMNYWQRLLPASHASLIYAAEPLTTSVYALFIPAWISHYAHIDYPNEIIGMHLLIGGGLITLANVLVLWKSPTPAPPVL